MCQKERGQERKKEERGDWVTESTDERTEKRKNKKTTPKRMGTGSSDCAMQQRQCNSNNKNTQNTQNTQRELFVFMTTICTAAKVRTR